MSRIQQRFQQAEKSGGSLLPYFTSGFPTRELTTEFILRADAAGATVVELGEPYSDSIADGPIIQESFYRALERGHRLHHTFEIVSEVRPKVACGLVSMCSYSVVHRNGLRAYMTAAAGAGFDGVIIPDVPVEEIARISDAAGTAGLCCIGLIAPTTTDVRRERIVSRATGFVYQIAAIGTTGERSTIASNLAAQVAALRGLTPLPVCVGFGIGTAAQVREVCSVADGAIVGSAIIRRIARALDSGHAPEEIAFDAEKFLVELAVGLRPSPSRVAR